MGLFMPKKVNFNNTVNVACFSEEKRSTHLQEPLKDFSEVRYPFSALRDFNLVFCSIEKEFNKFPKIGRKDYSHLKERCILLNTRILKLLEEYKLPENLEIMTRELEYEIDLLSILAQKADHLRIFIHTEQFAL